MRVCDRCKTNLRSFGVTYLIQRFEPGERESIFDTQLDYCDECDPDLGSAKQAERLSSATTSGPGALESLPNSPFLDGFDKAIKVMGGSDAADEEEDEGYLAQDHVIKAFLQDFVEMCQSEDGVNPTAVAALWARHDTGNWLLHTIAGKGGLISLFRTHLGDTEHAGGLLTLGSMYGLLPPDPHLL